MKKSFSFSALLLLLCCISFAQQNTSGFSKLSGPYLGQIPPGTTPEIFAPGIISTPLNELNSVFLPDGSEFYFCVRIPGASTLFMMNNHQGTWSKPETLPFNSKYNDIDVSVSPDGQILFFCSNRPVPDTGEARKDHDIWRTDRKGDTWGEPVRMGNEVNSDMEDFYPIITNNGSLYFNSQRAGAGTNDIYKAKLISGRYANAEKLGPEINSEFREYDAYVCPDEMYIIFSSERPGGSGNSDLYISFSKDDGSWTLARNMGVEINGPGPEFGAYVSPDGKYLFCTRGTVPLINNKKEPYNYDNYVKANLSPDNYSTNIWWVDAGIIDKLKQEELK